jgi:23S rRNA pseudouridine2605 synthase
MIRINKFLARAGVASRRGADLLIKNGRGTINGKTAVLGDKINGEEEVGVDGETIDDVEEKEYWAVYKPRGVVSTSSDEWGRSKITDLTKSIKRLYPVGRLDLDSEGLMILTNDGELSLKLTHPKFHLEKEYEVETDRKIDQAKINPGINNIKKVSGNKMWIIMYEGKKRQIRNMCWQAGLRVRKLLRIRIGKLELGNLKPGEIRKINISEIF